MVATTRVDLQKMVATTKVSLQKVAATTMFPCQTDASATPLVEATTDGSPRRQPVASAESSSPTEWAKPQTCILHISSLCLDGEEDELSLIVGCTVKILDWIAPTVAVFSVKKVSSKTIASAKDNEKPPPSSNLGGGIDVSSEVADYVSMASLGAESPADALTAMALTSSSIHVGPYSPFIGVPEASSVSVAVDPHGHSVMSLESIMAAPHSTSAASYLLQPSVVSAPIPVPFLGPIPIPLPSLEVGFDNKAGMALPGVAELLLLIPLLEHRVDDSMETVPLVRQVIPIGRGVSVVTRIECEDKGEDRGVLLAISMKGEGSGTSTMLISDSEELELTNRVRCVCPIRLDDSQTSSLLAICRRGVVTLLSTENWDVVGRYEDQPLNPSHCVFCPDRMELVVVSTEGKAQVLHLSVTEEDQEEDTSSLVGM